MLYYFDSSAVVKRYAPEKGSAWVKSIAVPTSGNTLYVGQIGVVEIAAALSKKVRNNELTEEAYEAASSLFLLDVRNEEYVIGLLTDHTIQSAVDLTKRHPLRAYDAVHLAIAIGLNVALLAVESPLLTFVSSDKTLCEAVGKEGLATDNPELH